METFPIIAKLGGRADVHQALHARSGRWTTPKSVEMWHRRRRIPADARDELMRLAEERGIPYCADDFVLPSELAPTQGAA